MRTRHLLSSSGPVPGHRTVLLHESVEQLAIKPGSVVVDTTLGGAGHAKLITEKLGKEGVFIGFDLDADAIERAREALSGSECTVHLVQANFRHLEEEMRKLGIEKVDAVLFDLGWSGFQLDAGRGFSFLADEPLTMTYAKEASESTLTAATIVNEWAEESIADVIFGWGEERYSRRIAKAIVERRKEKPFETSRELAEVIKASVPPVYRFGRIHPATRTFQALRIAVNDELGAITDGLNGAWKLLSSGGRIAVITFHSIEDRLVKRHFLALEESGEGKRITKSPIVPTDEELSGNPRARSAKLRVFTKI